ncbi:unnamed protein product [Cylindrotheca closterium]|uniref:Uncharacterized protein n=1 Tax=Cylindrotheca closterium TaxID=2856 RepID=A0AAD2JJW7_9STRA|nr:unnamed protein product [Cylindrotheca closterium]
MTLSDEDAKGQVVNSKERIDDQTKSKWHAQVFVYTGGNQKVPHDVVRGRIHPSCKRIEKEAFKERESLLAVEFSVGLQEICDGAFKECAGLEYIVTPSTLKKIGASAFFGCLNMKFIKLNRRLEHISTSAFKECCALEIVHLPPTVSKLGAFAFSKCCLLKEVALSRALKKVHKGTFDDCPELDLIVKQNYTLFAAGEPTDVKIDTNHRKASKDVFDKLEKLIAERKKKQVNDQGDSKPTIQTASNEDGKPAETLNIGNALKEKEKELANLHATLERKTEEFNALQSDMEGKLKKLTDDNESMKDKLQKATEENESTIEANVTLEQENECTRKAYNDIESKLNETESKLQSTKDFLEREKCEKAGTVERLLEITANYRALKAENVRLQKEKEDKDASLLKTTEKVGALREQIKTLRKQEHRRGHDSVVSADDTVPNDLEGISIGLDSSQSRTARSKVSSVTGGEHFESCAEDLESSAKRSWQSTRKRKRTPKEASTKSPENCVKHVKALEQRLAKMKKNLQTTETEAEGETNDTNESQSG